MSWNPALDADCPTGDAVDAIETVIVPRARDIGGFEVRRALPAPRRQMLDLLFSLIKWGRPNL